MSMWDPDIKCPHSVLLCIKISILKCSSILLIHHYAQDVVTIDDNGSVWFQTSAIYLSSVHLGPPSCQRASRSEADNHRSLYPACVLLTNDLAETGCCVCQSHKQCLNLMLPEMKRKSQSRRGFPCGILGKQPGTLRDLEAEVQLFNQSFSREGCTGCDFPACHL